MKTVYDVSDSVGSVLNLNPFYVPDCTTINAAELDMSPMWSIHGDMYYLSLHFDSARFVDVEYLVHELGMDNVLLLGGIDQIDRNKTEYTVEGYVSQETLNRLRTIDKANVVVSSREISRTIY